MLLTAIQLHASFRDLAGIVIGAGVFGPIGLGIGYLMGRLSRRR